ncbi:MAG: DNA polymerase domain-containing protein, partial [Candidatus Roizmanbacteria bacterium]
MAELERITAKPFLWVGKDVTDEDGFNKYVVRVYAHNEKKQTIAIVLPDFEPWLEFVLPADVTGNEIETMADAVKYTLTQKFSKEGHQPTKVIATKRLPLYYYHKKKRYCLRIHFKSEDAVNHAKNYLQKYELHTYRFGDIKLVPTAVKIGQIIRLHAEKNIKQCDWMTFIGQDNIGKNSQTTCDIEYIASYQSIEQCSEESSKTLGPNRFSYIIFDGEMMSHRRYAFPDELNSEDPVFMWGVIYAYWSHEDNEYKFKEYCLVYHPTLGREAVGKIYGSKMVQLGPEKYDFPVTEEEVEIRWHNDEIDLCDDLENIFIEHNPDGLITHNGDAFDLKYHKVRKARQAQPFQNISRLKDWNQSWQNIKWESSAYNEINLWIPDGEGRIYFDTMLMAKRDYKCDSYTLEFLCQKYMGVGKHKWTAEDIFRAFRDGDPEDMKKTIIYCLRDCWCTWGLFQHLNFDTSYVGMASIIGVPIFDLFSRGQGIRTMAQMFLACHKLGYYLYAPERIRQSIAGGHVFPNCKGIEEWVWLIDFEGLYPSIMRYFNISNDTFDPEKKVPDEDCNILKWTDQFGYHETRFVKPHIRKGIVPHILEHYTTSRGISKGKMNACKKAGDNRGYMTHFVDQNSYKVSSNSVYGGLAQPGGALALEEGGAAVTAYGRMLAQNAGKWAIDEGYKIVYGDTDSIMITKIGGFTDEEKLNFRAVGEAFVKRLNAANFKAPIGMALDGCFRVIHSIEKKMYCYVKYDDADPL